MKVQRDNFQAVSICVDDSEAVVVVYRESTEYATRTMEHQEEMGKIWSTFRTLCFRFGEAIMVLVAYSVLSLY